MTDARITELEARLAEAEAALRARTTVDILRADEDRQTFLLRLSDALRSSDDPDEVIATASRLLGERLGASRVIFGEIDEAVGVAHLRQGWAAAGTGELPATLLLDDLGGPLLDDLRAGRAVCYDDVGEQPHDRADLAALAAIGVRSGLSVPLLIDGRFVVNLNVHQIGPRRWTDAEVDLVGDVAERLWAAVERARAEAALRDSEQKYRTLFDSIDEGFAVVEVIVNDTGRPVDLLHLEANDAYERHTGLRDIVGRRALEIVPEGGPLLDFFGDVALTGQAARTESYLPPPVDRWVAGYASRIGGDGSRRIAVVFSDISERKRVEHDLHDSERRLLLAMRAGHQFGWEIDLNSEQVSYSGDQKEVLGFELPASEEGRLSVLHPDDRQASADAYARSMSTHEPINMDQRYIVPGSDGAVVWVHTEGDFFGDPPRFVGVMRNITTEKLAEQALREHERFSRALVEGVPQLIWRAVDGGHWTWASRQWTAYTGQSEPDSHDRGWLEPVHPDDRERVMAIWSHAVERGEFAADYRICHAGEHRYRWFQTRATPVRDDAGTIVEWLGTSTDIDDLRTLQDRQQILVAELQHRTRNLMGVVRSMADKTSRASRDLPDFRERFRDRLTALARVQGLLSRLNDYDRVAFDELIRSEIEALTGASAQVVLDGPAGVRLRSSTVQTLAMALHELGTNAVKYGALGQAGGHLAVTWSLAARDAKGRPWLHVDWRERGVTVPIDPTTGQARELIERALPYQLGARTSYELGADGVHCTIAMPVSASTVAEGGSSG